MELLTSPKPFSLMNGRLWEPFPKFPEPPTPSLPDSLNSRAASETLLMSVILLLIRGNVHGARLKPYELV